MERTDRTERDAPPPSVNTARLRIAHLKLAESDDLARALRRAVELSARTLGTARVGVWLLGEGRASLVPISVHDESTSFQGENDVLPLATWPAYAEAIDSRRVIAAKDVFVDPATRELKDYLSARGISSMLDVPIFLSGEVWGIVCHEHTGRQRQWHPHEIDFAISVADMISALLEQSRRLAAEAELRVKEVIIARTRREEALTRMGAGVGHDFNTILHAITLLVEAASTEADEGRRREVLRSALEECHRGARLSRRLLDFARTAHGAASPIDLGHVAADMQRPLAVLLEPTHRLAFDAEDGCWVTADRAELEQVILNLVTNARDAMPNGGEVRLAVRLEETTPVLRVSDDGVGILPSDLDRIFDPFFSTKPADRGHGLGLSTVQSIAEGRGATVEVESLLGRGSTFMVRWPPP